MSTKKPSGRTLHPFPLALDHRFYVEMVRMHHAARKRSAELCEAPVNRVCPERPDPGPCSPSVLVGGRCYHCGE